MYLISKLKQYVMKQWTTDGKQKQDRKKQLTLDDNFLCDALVLKYALLESAIVIF